MLQLDTEDRDLVEGRRWHVNATGYWQRYTHKQNGRSRYEFLHHVVLARIGARPSARHQADHRNGDVEDNRRSNLRWVTPSQNSWNTRGRNGTGYKGVYQLKRSPFTFTAQIAKRYLGIYPTAEAAARAYDQAARQLGGDYARLNFPHA